MQALEEQVIARMIHEGSPMKAVNYGVNVDWFRDTACRIAWEHIVDFASSPATRNKCPSKARIEKLVPGLHVGDCPEENLEELLVDLQDVRARAILQTGIVDLNDILRTAGVEMAIAHLNELQRDLGENMVRAAHESMDLADAIPGFMDAYTRLEQGGGMLGIPFPWPPLNKAGGLEPGTLTTIYAPSKNGKTWIALEIGALYPFEHANARCLIISMEMSVRQCFRRILSRLCRFDYSEVTEGRLPLDARDEKFDMLTELQEEQMEAMRSQLSDNKNYRDIRVCKPRVAEGGGVNAVRAEIERFRPDVVVVDGVYLMADDRKKGRRDSDWKTVANITQDLKRLADEKNIPIVVTNQSNRDGVKRKMDKNTDFDSYADMGFGLSAVQDSDMVIRLHKIRDYQNGNDRILVTVPAVRDAIVEPFTISFRPVISFDLDMVNITPDQIAMLNVENDEEDAPAARPIRGSSRNRDTTPEFEIAEFDPWEE